MAPTCDGTFLSRTPESFTDVKQVDEEEEGGLRGLTEVLLSYGERHFDAANQGVWASVLLLCGQFERVRFPHQHGVSFWLTPFYKGCCCTVGAFGNRNRGGSSCDCIGVPWSFVRPFTSRDIRARPLYVLSVLYT